MLNSETKRKIDSARNILVGKVPDPKAQVEQITTALIYKFMDDMDKESEELGGKTRFFADDFSQYSWTKLLDKKLSGEKRLDLYVQAIANMSKNRNIPELFRNIFKGAFLPFRDSRTLSLFLKEINEFSYDHSEELGNAFEYLLSILGSQGDAGQFRTPRHIIDFITAVVDPKKNETILDPACGTAGFLISAYKHILKAHDGLDNKTGRPTNKEKNLTPDEKTTLMENIVGYDISPDMVKLSLVNMYLHDFQSPQIHEYDSLTSEERWGKEFDVIMANPPFMTPKGGIQPHAKFSVQANRAEVLFVDYIIEHLRTNGRAGIIVPEGIIFKGDKAYQSLRKKLVDDGLFAVVSLPPGVFQPYSGVKTSILLFDNQVAKKKKKVLFVKISNDGFDLGAQRRVIDKNNLPLALEIIKKYKSPLDDKKFSEDEKQIAHIVAKEKIIATGDYNLSRERYREVEVYKNVKWKMVELEKVCEFKNGLWKGKKEPFQTIKIIRSTNFGKKGELNLSDIAEHPVEIKQLKERKLKNGDIVLENSGGGPTQPVGRVIYFEVSNNDIYSWSNFTSRVRVKDERLNSKYLFHILNNFYQTGGTNNLQRQTSGIKNLEKKAYQKIKIPLPPLSIQKEIVEQIEVKQNAIDHARSIIQNLERERQYFGQELKKLDDVDMVELEKVCLKIFAGGDKPKNLNKDQKFPTEEYPHPIFSNGTDENSLYGYTNNYKVDKEAVTISARGTIGFHTIRKPNFTPIVRLITLIPNNDIVNTKFLNYALDITEIGHSGCSIPQLTIPNVKKIKIPLPSLAVQKQLVAEAQKEEEIITANKNLIEIMERKIEKVIAEL